MVRGENKAGDVWTFSTDDRARAEVILAEMKTTLQNVTLLEMPAKTDLSPTGH